MIDIRMFIIVLVITSLIQLVVLYQQYKINKAYKGIIWWLMWSIFSCTGFVGLIIREIPSLRLLGITIQNSTIFLATIFIYIGMKQFLDRKINFKIISLVSVVYIITIIYFSYFNDSVFMRSAIFNVSVATTSLMTSYVLFIHKIPSVKKSANFNAIVSLLHSSIFWYRTVIFLIGEKNDVFSPTFFSLIPFIDSLIIGLLTTFGIVIMINQKLNAENIKDKENLELIFNTNPDSILITRLEDGHFVKVNENFIIFSGYTRNEVISKSSLEINMWKSPMERQLVVNMLNDKGFCENMEFDFLRKDGSTLNGLLNAKSFTLQNVPHLISVIRDITLYKEVEKARQIIDRQFQIILSTLYGGILVISVDGKVQYANQSLCNLFELNASPESLIGLSVKEIMARIICLYEDKPYAISRISQLVSTRQPVKDEEVSVIGNRTYMVDYLPIVIDGKDHGRIWHHRDITAQKRNEEKLREMSIKDPLTNIFNRRYIFDRIDVLFAERNRNAVNFSIAIIDLDHFKKVNDTHGHQAGDLILIEIANIIKSSIRPYDILGRYGGEEFIIIFTNSDKKLIKAKLENVLDIVRRKKFIYKQQEILITFSGGVSDSSEIYENDVPVDKIVELADIRLYEAKTAGRNKVM